MSTLLTDDSSWSIIESGGRADSPLLGFAPQGCASNDPLHYPSPNYVRQLPEDESLPVSSPLSPASEGEEDDSDCPSPLRRNYHGSTRRVSFILPEHPVRRRPSLPIFSTPRPHSMTMTLVPPTRSHSMSVAPPVRTARSHSMTVVPSVLANFPSPPLSPPWRTQRPTSPRTAPPPPTSPIMRSPSPVLECQELNFPVIPSGLLGGEELQSDGFVFRPGSSQGHRPGSSQGYRPGSSLGYRPDSSQGHRPGSSQGYRPGSSQGHRPGSLMGYRPGSSQGYRPGSSQGYRPGSSQGYWQSNQDLPTLIESQYRSTGNNDHQAVGFPRSSISFEDVVDVVDSGFDDDASYYSKEMTLLSSSFRKNLDEADGRRTSRLSLSFIEMDDQNKRGSSRTKKLSKDKIKAFVIRFIAGPDARHFIHPSTKPPDCMNTLQALARW